MTKNLSAAGVGFGRQHEWLNQPAGQTHHRNYRLQRPSTKAADCALRPEFIDPRINITLYHADPERHWHYPGIETTEDGMPSHTIFIAGSLNKEFRSNFSDIIETPAQYIGDMTMFGPIPPVAEDGAAFEEYAYKKASLTARHPGFTAMANDSGPAVDHLGGAPGAHPAPHAGGNAFGHDPPYFYLRVDKAFARLSMKEALSSQASIAGYFTAL